MNGADLIIAILKKEGVEYMFAPGAIGGGGGAHAISVLRDELRSTMGQLGCGDVGRLPEFLISGE